MTDREKVIKWLDSCGSDLTELDKGCRTCPYYEFSGHTEYDFDFTCIRMLSRDAIELLKEQEAVEPTLIREGRNKHYNDYVCPRCDNDVVYEQNYCSECGVRFLWEGR